MKGMIFIEKRSRKRNSPVIKVQNRKVRMIQRIFLNRNQGYICIRSSIRNRIKKYQKSVQESAFILREGELRG